MSLLLFIVIFQNMKRLIIALTVISLGMACFAADIEEIIAKAYENSSQVEQYERSRKDSLMNAGASDTSWFYDISVDQPVYFDGNGYHLPGASASLTYSDKVTDTDITGLLSYNPVRLVDNSFSHTLSGSVKISRTFDFDGWTSTDYSRKVRDINIELSYCTNVLSFRKSVLADVYSIVDAKQAIEKAEKSLADKRRSYSAKLESGELKEGSSAQIMEKMTLDSSASSLDSQKKALESRLTAFEKNYGFAYTGVDSAPRPDLSFEENPEGNSNVYAAYLNLLSAEQALYNKTGKGSRIRISAGMTPFMFVNGSPYQSSSFSLNSGVTYSNGNFSVGADLTEEYSKSEWGKPVLTITGSYSGGNNNTAEINRLESDVYAKQLAYDNALYSYRTSARAVSDNIQSALAAYEQLEIQKDYHRMMLEAAQQLFDRGFTTQSALDQAADDVKYDEIQELMLNLKALQLECDIEILAL